MTNITKRLGLWDMYLAVMDKVGIRPFKYGQTLVITNTPLVKLIVVTSSDLPNRIDKVKTVDVLGQEVIHKDMREFEQWFQSTFRSSRKAIENDYDALVIETAVSVTYHGFIPGEIYKHPNTLEVLSPGRWDLKPGATMNIACPFTLELPQDVIGVFYPKMKLSDKKINVRAPLLHAGFSGIPQLIITNDSDETVEIGQHDAISQIQFVKSTVITFETSQQLTDQPE